MFLKFFRIRFIWKCARKTGGISTLDGIAYLCAKYKPVVSREDLGQSFSTWASSVSTPNGTVT